MAGAGGSQGVLVGMGRCGSEGGHFSALSSGPLFFSHIEKWNLSGKESLPVLGSQRLLGKALRVWPQSH